MSEKLPNGNTSRFLSHFVFADAGEESQKLSDRLAGILRKRFPDDSFVQIECVDIPGTTVLQPGRPGDFISQNPAACGKTLFIGIGMGGLTAYTMQQDPRYRGVSVFAISPPPVNRSIGTAHLIDSESELSNFHWKRPVVGSGPKKLPTQ